MLSRRAVVVSSVLALVSCTKDRPTWPGGTAEVDTIKVKQGVVALSPALSNAAKVSKNQLSFPASMAGDVMAAWPTGAVMVGQPAADVEGRRNNPFGFLRKVTGTRIEGDAVVVDTEPALLEDAVTGDFHHEFDVDSAPRLELAPDTDLSAYDVPVNVADGTDFPYGLSTPNSTSQPLEQTGSNGLTLFGKKRQALSLNGPTLSIPELPLPLMAYSKKWNTPENRPGVGINLSGQVKVTPLVSVSPRMVIDLSVGISGLKRFEFSVGGTLKAGARYDVNYSAVPEPDTSLLEAINIREALKRTPIKLNAPPLELGQPVKTVVGSIGPVPVVQVTGAYLACEVNFSGGVHVKGEVSATISPMVGVRYDTDNGWQPVADFPFVKPTFSADVLSGEGGVELDCGVILRTELLVADAAGPYAQVRRDIVAHADYAEECPARATDTAFKSHAPDSKLTLGIKAYDSLQVGIEFSIAHVISIGKGPYDVFRQNYLPGTPMQVPNPTYSAACGSICGPQTFTKYTWEDIVSKTKTGVRQGAGRPGAGLWCVVNCDDGVKNGTESDVDCGGSCGKCSGGKTCSTIDDCISGACGADGKCAASRCEDGFKDDQETDVDCGGPTCNACPYYFFGPNGSYRFATCALDRDCELGFCSKDAVTPSTCTVNLCRDGRVSGSEPSVDCGASDGCTTLCATGQHCNTGADCEGHACNVTSSLCVANTCLDGMRDGDEADVDCGGSCPTKCALGASCDFANRGDADCASGVCRSSGLGAVDSICVASTCEDRRVDGDEAGLDCGGSCANRCPIGETCRATADCVSGTLCNVKSRRCAAPGCDDAIKNGQESSVDCGGPSCLKCAVSKACNVDSDCVSNTCTGGKCVGGPCENGVKDTGEVDVDCGGTCGLGCATGLSCNVARDCQSNLCVGNKCISDPCLDRVRNGSETDADCGGTTCTARCATGQACNLNADCASNLCNTTTHSCVADACHDGVLAANETDVDCGGACATKCAVNKLCAANADCASTVCNATTHRCVPDTCFDGVKNGNETDLDCGGNCDPKCAVNKSCAVGTDCQSGSCTATTSTCAADQCSDGRRNGSESAVDCGGTCATKCAVGAPCAVGTDCVNPQGLVGVAGFCSLASNTCVSTSCGDGAKDGDETGVDCGGSCGKCAVGGGCATGTDCTSTFCNVTTHLCAADQCGDGVKNGTETDIDCGGNTCGGCADNKACVQPWDCTSGYCGGTNLCIPPVPRSCYELYAFQYLRTDGVYVIDPDGPRTRASTNEKGNNKPFPTFCKLADENAEPGGWTPVYFANSQGRIDYPFLDYTRMHDSDPTPVSCSGTTFVCPAAGDTCREDATGALCTTAPCHCSGPGNWDPATAPSLRGNPQNYSVQTANVQDTYTWNLAVATAANRSVGYRALTGNPFEPVEFRWTAYRNGSLVFDSRRMVVVTPPGYQWNVQGQIRPEVNVANDSLNLGWCQVVVNGGRSTAAEPATYPSGTVPAYPLNDNISAGGGRTVEGNCRRFGKNVATMINQPLMTSAVSVDWLERIIPQGADGLATAATPYVGMWIGRYGTNGTDPNYNYPAWPDMPPIIGAFVSEYGSMGICNGMSSTDPVVRRTLCKAYTHPQMNTAGQGVPFAFGTGELTDPTKGSTFQSYVPGMTVVLWARHY